jgi:MFS family permease
MDTNKVGTAEKESIWSRNFLLLMGITFCSGMTAQLISTAMTPYLTYGLLLSTAIAGVLSSIYTIVSSVGRLFAGSLVDRFSRKPFIFLGFVLFGLGSFGFSMTSNLTGLIIFRVLQGLGFAVSSAACSAAAADVIPPSRLGSGLGYMSMVNALTQIIGPLLCTCLIGVSMYALPFRAAAVICVAALVVAVFTEDVFRKNKENIPKAKSGGLASIFERHALIPAGLQFLISFAFSTYMVWGFNLAVEKGFGEIQFGPLTFTGMFFAIAALGMILARAAVTKIIDRTNEYMICIPACVLGAISFLLCYGNTSAVRFMLGSALYGACLGIVQPSLNTLALKNAVANRRGAATATFMLGFDGGIGVGATAWGLILAASSYDFMLLLSSGILVLAGLLSCLLWRKTA